MGNSNHLYDGMAQELQVLLSHESKEWGTPEYYIHKVRMVFGDQIDLDPASCALANETVGARVYFSKENNGLTQDWFGEVWLNPDNHGKICPCQCHIHNAQNANSSSHQQQNILHQDRQKPMDSRHGVENVYEKTTGEELEYINRQNQEKEDTILPEMDLVIAPNAEQQSLLIANIFLSALVQEQDLTHGAVNALENLLGLSRQGDALILLNQISCFLKRADTMLRKGENYENEFGQESIIIKGGKDVSLASGIGLLEIGRNARNIGTINALTAAGIHELPKIILSLFLTQIVQEQYQRTLFQPAISAIVQNVTSPHTNGVRTRELSTKSWNISQSCPNCEGCIPLRFPSKVFLNPPYSKTNGKSNQEIWANKLIEEYESGRVKEAILLTKASIGYSWFKKLWVIYPCCLCFDLISFIDLDNPTALPKPAKLGSAFFYLGPNEDRFRDYFETIGMVTP